MPPAGDQPQPLLLPHVNVTRLSHVYRGRGAVTHALEDIDLSIARGEFIAVLGPSGSGKSTLLRAICGLLRPSRGRVLISGRDPGYARREKSIGVVFQDAALLPWRTVLENISLPLEVNRGGGRGSADSLLEMVGLAEFQGYYPYQLSGGMKQRVALARALVHQPDLLLMDEPFGSLDEITRSQMRWELQRIWLGSGKTVVFVTHSISEALLLGDRVVVLTSRPGRVKAIVTVDLPRPREERTQASERFLLYLEQVRELVQVER